MKRLPRAQGAALGAALVLGCLLLGGCGTKVPEQTLSEEELVRGLAGSISDFARTPEEFQRLFVPGSVPPEKERKRYGQLMYFPQKATISGDQAEILMRIEDSNNQPVGEVTWKAVKQGQEWKLSAAPLP